MRITKNEHYTELLADDVNGEWSVQVQNDGSQVRIKADNGDSEAYINTSTAELYSLANMLISIVFTRRFQLSINIEKQFEETLTELTTLKSINKQ